MPINVEAQLRRELSADEKLLWSGAPAQGIRLRAADMLIIPFSLMWCGFAFFWEAGVLMSTGARFTPTPPFVTGTVVTFMAIWGIPFCTMGLYIVFGRFFVDAWLRARTAYGVTDHRVIIVRSGSVRSLALSALPEIEMREGGKGQGSLTFGAASFFSIPGWPAWGRSGYKQPMVFEGIAKVRDVYNLILATARGR